MKITKYLFILTAFIAAGIQSVYAQSTDSEHKGLLWSSLHGLDYEFKAGVNIGGLLHFLFHKKSEVLTVILPDWQSHWREAPPSGLMSKRNGELV